MENSFINFLEKTPPTGKAIVCIDNKNTRKILNKIRNKNILTYGESKNANYQISNIRYNVDYSFFDISYKDIKKRSKKISGIQLSLLGKHNVLNGAAAVAVCLNLGVNKKVIKKSLKNYSGVQRRMTKIFSKNQNDFYDDYAHHPTEITSILEGVRNVYKKRNIVTIFEPHRYSRVISLKQNFSKSFSNSDVVLLCPIYAAGEKKNQKYDQIKFAKLISKFSKTQVILIKDKYQIKEYLKKNLISNEIIIGMGAGLISKWMNELKTDL